MSMADARIARLGMTPRQRKLNALWAWYRCANYDTRSVNWDGSEHMDALDSEIFAQQSTIPPGFRNAADDYPIRFRRPSVPHRLPKVIVDRFSSLLFSERLHPRLMVRASDEVKVLADAIVRTARLWSAMTQARAHGGAMGTAVVGFVFVSGKPQVEVHDPRWVEPVWADRRAMVLKGIEKRYQFPKEELDKRGMVKTTWYWARRVIDEQRDVVYHPEPVKDGDEPVWRERKAVKHGLGFCPVVWAQNLPVDDSVDGDTDCEGVYELVEAMDQLLSQAHRAIIANCDPTLILRTNQDTDGVRKGSKHAITLTPDGGANYLEISGTGIAMARQMAAELRELALETAQCVLENTGDGAPVTATEVVRRYSAMLAKADVLREQYGERLLKPLVDMMLRAALVLLATDEVDEAGTRTAGTLDLEPPESDEDTELLERLLIDEHLQAQVAEEHPTLTLQWPVYFAPTLQEITAAAQAAAAAKSTGVVDDEALAEFLAPYFGVEDPLGRLEAAREQAAAAQAELDDEMIGAQDPEPERPDPQQARGALELVQQYQQGALSYEAAAGLLVTSLKIPVDQAHRMLLTSGQGGEA